MMKYFLIILVLVSLLSCSEEIIDFQNEDKSVISLTEIFKELDTKDILPQDILPQDLIKFRIELTSYLIGRTLINNEDIRTQFVDLFNDNNNTININTLFSNSNFSEFNVAFQLEYFRYWFSLHPYIQGTSSHPGDEGFGIEPLEYTPGIGIPGRHKEITFLELETIVTNEYNEYLIFLSQNECLELFFPNPLNFINNDIRVTTVVSEINGNINKIYGGELYRFEELNAGELVLINSNYINNNNLLVIRPTTSSICGNMEL